MNKIDQYYFLKKKTNIFVYSKYMIPLSFVSFLIPLLFLFYTGFPFGLRLSLISISLISSFFLIYFIKNYIYNKKQKKEIFKMNYQKKFFRFGFFTIILYNITIYFLLFLNVLKSLNFFLSFGFSILFFTFILFSLFVILFQDSNIKKIKVTEDLHIFLNSFFNLILIFYFTVVLLFGVSFIFYLSFINLYNGYSPYISSFILFLILSPLSLILFLKLSKLKKEDILLSIKDFEQLEYFSQDQELKEEIFRLEHEQLTSTVLLFVKTNSKNYCGFVKIQDKPSIKFWIPHNLNSEKNLYFKKNDQISFVYNVYSNVILNFEQ